MKTDLTRTNLLRKYAKPIVHMRHQFEKGMFGLVFGAGISKSFGLPNWADLVQLIAQNSNVQGREILAGNGSTSQASLTQMLFEHYKSKELENCINSGRAHSKELDKQIMNDFRNIVHKELWRDFQPNVLKKDQHPYLDAYLNIIKKSSLTINYNFDDTLQTMIMARRTPEEIDEGTKLYETVYDARLQFRQNKGVIYHPNGFLPRNLIEGASDDLVFSEDSFADQLIASMSGHYSTLLHHLSKNTCLFIGLSLEDNTLKHLLRQSAIINPGHYHYFVSFSKRPSSLNAERTKAFTASNFTLYNLITLYLNEEDLKTLGELVQTKEDIFDDDCRVAKVPRRYIFYITGAVGCGKTTTLSYFRNLTTFSEWPEQRHPLLGKRFKELTRRETQVVDEWIGSMFFKKNRNLTHIEEGITIIDRTPLDPLTFTPLNKWKQKAIFLNDNISRDGAFRIVPGHVIILCGNHEAIASRVRVRQKKSTYQTKDVKEMYNKFDATFEAFKSGVSKIDTQELTIHEVVKRVAKIVHLEAYHEIDLHSVLDDKLKKVLL